MISGIVGSVNKAFAFDNGSEALIYSTETANGNIEVCCDSSIGGASMTNVKCPGGVNALNPASGVTLTYKDIAAGKRVVIKATQVQGAHVDGLANTFTVVPTAGGYTAVAYWW